MGYFLLASIQIQELNWAELAILTLFQYLINYSYNAVNVYGQWRYSFAC
jgi:hypothetical protein